MKGCLYRGADLIKVSSKEENDFIRRTGQKWWLGLHRDVTNDHVFRWNDGLTADAGFTNWEVGEPSNANNKENCVECFGSGWWNDLPCHSLRHLACEKGKQRTDLFLTVIDFAETNLKKSPSPSTSIYISQS